jgi:hypothetical protein
MRFGRASGTLFLFCFVAALFFVSKGDAETYKIGTIPLYEANVSVPAYSTDYFISGSSIDAKTSSKYPPNFLASNESLDFYSIFHHYGSGESSDEIYWDLHLNTTRYVSEMEAL